jgi:hypothetical protein
VTAGFSLAQSLSTMFRSGTWFEIV